MQVIFSLKILGVLTSQSNPTRNKVNAQLINDAVKSEKLRLLFLLNLICYSFAEVFAFRQFPVSDWSIYSLNHY